MEPIINFIEQYWGYTVVGGVTFGTLLTFVGMFIKQFISNGKFKKYTDGILAQYKNAVDIIGKAKEETEEVRALMLKEKQEKEYMQRVVAASFEAISYLTMASKLSIKEKLELQEKLNTVVVAPVITEVKEMVEEVVVEKQPELVDSLTESVTKAKTILDQFMNDEEK